MGQHVRRLEAEKLEQRIDDADVGGIEQPPDDTDDDRRDRHRQNQRHAYQPRETQFAGDDQRQQQPQQCLDRDRKNDKPRRRPDRLPEDRIDIDGGKVVPAGKAHIEAVAVSVQAGKDTVDGRV